MSQKADETSADALVACIALQVMPATAGSCSWSAKMEEDEGGSVMTASVCGGAKQDAHLMLSCLGQPTLSYDLGTAGQQLEPGHLCLIRP